MFKKKKLLYTILLLFLVHGCISVSDMIGDDNVETIEPQDEVGQLLSDIQDEQLEMIDDQVADPVPEKLETSDQKLDPVPTEKYDSVLLEDKEEQVQNESENVEIPLSKQDDFQSFENTISKLTINDKIQYRVATINFYSGSSLVDNVGLKKIRKIANIAKERNAKIKIVGHASKRTRDMPLAEHKLVNFNISDKRAQSVANIFIKKYSFPSYNLITEAVSDTKPLFKENMPAGTKANQRTEIFLIY